MTEQEALRKQLQQEQELLQTFQESQEAKLLAQHEREKKALDEKVEASKRELEKQVCVHVCMYMGLFVCDFYIFSPQIFEESTKLQNLRLERQKELQKRHLRELRDFAEAFCNDKVSMTSADRQSAERSSLTSDQSNTNVSMGTASL